MNATTSTTRNTHADSPKPSRQQRRKEWAEANVRTIPVSTRATKLKLHTNTAPLPPSQKAHPFDSLETFRMSADDWFGNARSFRSVFGGRFELEKYDEKTMWFDDETLQEIESAAARLIEIVRAAKIIQRKPSYLQLVSGVAV